MTLRILPALVYRSSLSQIDHRTEGFDNDMDAGLPLEEAANRWFPLHGTKTGGCEAYLGCQFQSVCLNKPRAEEALKGFRGRTPLEVTEGREAVK